MTNDRAVRITVALQISAASMALILAGEETIASGFAMLMLTAIALFLNSPWPKQPEVRKKLWNLLALLMLAAFLGELVATRQILTPVVRLVVFLTAYKYITAQTNRDWSTVLMLGFLQMLAATSISYSTLFAVSFIFFVLFSCLALMLLTVKSGRERAEITHILITGALPGSTSNNAPVSLLPKALVIVLGVLLLTAVIFPLLPRIRADVGGVSASQSIRSLSGFSQVIDLNAMSDIKQDPRVVMRVSLAGNQQAVERNLKLRGLVLTFFDGRTWSHAWINGRRIFRNAENRFDVQQVEGLPLRQEILMHPMNNRVIFGIGRPARVRGPFSMIFMDDMESMLMPSAKRQQIQYEVDSRLPEYSFEQLQEARLSDIPVDIRPFLQLPENRSFTRADFERIRLLALDIAGEDSRLLESVVRIEQWLQSSFEYSLELSQYSGSRNPMISFLFDRRSGHCSYFASGMTIMLRSLGVPARIVNGFQLGQYNTVGNFYTVRAADAHSWVEVWFPGAGWIPFDPTPAVGQSSEFAREEPFFLATLWESLDLWWNQNILAFDRNDQRDFLTSVVGGIRDTFSSIHSLAISLADLIPGLSSFEWLRQAGTALIFACILLLLAAGVWFLLRMVASWQRGRMSGVNTRIDFYEDAVALLKRRGIEQPRHSTAREWASATPPALQTVTRQLVDAYEQVRFSLNPRVKKQASQAGSVLLQKLKQQMQPGSRES